MNKYKIDVSQELLSLIGKDIEKEKRQLRKCIKESKQQTILEKKVNMQRMQKYMENKITLMRKFLLEMENLNNK